MSDLNEEDTLPIGMPVYTVYGFRYETWQRFAQAVEALNARQAEDLVTLACEKEGGPIGVVAVVEGRHPDVSVEYCDWILPDAKDQSEVDSARRAGGCVLWTPEQEEPKKKKWDAWTGWHHSHG